MNQGIEGSLPIPLYEDIIVGIKLTDDKHNRVMEIDEFKLGINEILNALIEISIIDF